jgi:hypothetical protein
MKGNLNYPYPGQNKSENSNYAKSLIQQFCTVNNIPVPKFVVNNRTDCFGFYRRGTNTITVNEKLCKTPVKTPGFTWSYTGYKADLTVAGVWAHEFGHYVDNVLQQISSKMNVKGESNVSSYEPNNSERFAESMKLFILNPDLLKQGRPKRYEFLTKICGLKPVINDVWEIVLGNAHEKLITATRNWVKK